MKRILSGVLAAGLMLLTFPALAASAADTAEPEEVVAVAPAAEEATSPAPEPEAPPVEVKEEVAEPDPVAVPPTVAKVDKPEKKEHLWVDICKYVGKPGDDERLKDGKQPIRVSYKATEAPEVGAYFNDAHGRSYVVAVFEKEDAPTTDVSACPAPDAFKPRYENLRWLVPAEVGDPRGKTVDATFFPQPLLTTLPCGRWSQDDKYFIENKADDDLFKSLGDVLEWISGHPEDSKIYYSHGWTYGGDCPPPAPKVTLDWSQVCGAITLTTVNNDAVPAGWYYGLQGKVDGIRVVSAVQKGPGTKESTKTFVEDFNGGSVDVEVSVYAATEQDLLPAEWPYGKTITVTVDTDCLPNQHPAEPRTKTEESCELGGYTHYTGTEAYIETEPGVWVLSGVVVWDVETTFTAYSDEEYFKACAPDEPTKDPHVVIGKWGDGQPTCSNPEVEVERTTTTTTFTYEWNVQTRVWDETATDTVEVDTKTVTLGDDVDCSPDVPETLAYTGGGDEPLGWIGLSLLGFGLLMVAMARKGAKA